MYINIQYIYIYLSDSVVVWSSHLPQAQQQSCKQTAHQRNAGLSDLPPRARLQCTEFSPPHAAPPQSSASPYPSLRPLKSGKKHTSFPPHTHMHAHTRLDAHMYTDWQVLPFLPPLHSCQSSKFLLFLQFQASLVWKGFNKSVCSTFLIFICSE